MSSNVFGSARRMMRWLALVAFLALFAAGCGSRAQPLSPIGGLSARLTPLATPPPQRCVAASPAPSDGQVDTSGARVARFTLGEAARLGDAPDAPLAFSPDGRWLALSTAVGVTLYDAPTLTPRLACPFPSGVLALAFTPDSAALTANGVTRDVATWRLPSGELEGVAARPGNEVGRIACAPDGGSYVVADSGLVSLFRVSGHEPQWTTTVSRGTIAGVFFSDGGQTIVVADTGVKDPHNFTPMTLRRLGATDGRVLEEHVGPIVFRAALNPDRRLLARWGDLLYVIPLDDMDALPLLSADPPERVTTLTFVARGTMLAVGDAEGKITLWDLGNGRLIKRLPIHTGEVSNLATSPDGTMIASSSPDGTVRLTPVTLWR